MYVRTRVWYAVSKEHQHHIQKCHTNIMCEWIIFDVGRLVHRHSPPYNKYCWFYTLLSLFVAFVLSFFACYFLFCFFFLISFGVCGLNVKYTHFSVFVAKVFFIHCPFHWWIEKNWSKIVYRTIEEMVQT